MKTLIVALAALLSVASVEAQQRYLLPIGSNVNNRPAKVGISIGNRDTGWFIEDEFQYIPTMGDLETVVKSHLQKLANNFVPPQGSLNDSYSIGLGVDPGPYQTPKVFTLQQDGTIPPEVLEVKLHYGTSWIYPVKGAKEIRMRLFKDDKQTASFSTANPNDGYGFTLSPCSIGATQDALARDEVRVSSKYIVPSLWDGTWDYGEMDVLTDAGDYAVINLLNGFVIQYSTLDFMEFLRAPEMQSAQSQAPVLVISSPRISRIARIGHTTEITVSVEASGNAHLEFAEAIGGNWSAVPAYPVPLALKAGSSTFTHTTESPTAFYRLRVVDSLKGQ